jgi:hypothetical protein
VSNNRVHVVAEKCGHKAEPPVTVTCKLYFRRNIIQGCVIGHGKVHSS